jgi:type VI secretion system protein ImpF
MPLDCLPGTIVMPSLRAEPEFVLSALDRLIDLEPELAADARDGRAGPLDRVKESIRSNLTWLLNSRRPLVDLPPGRHHLQRSLLTYGLPDFAHLSMETAEEREALRAAIEAAIRRFEPRLSRVVVNPPGAEPSGGNLRFQVDAILDVRPAPEVVTFDSVLLLPARAFELRG